MSHEAKPPRVQLAALPCGSGQTSLSPCQFLRRQQVLQLYRKILRAIREVPAEQDRRYLKDWAREEFRRNKDATEEVRIGNPQLRSPALGTGHCNVLSCLGGFFCRCRFQTAEKSPVLCFLVLPFSSQGPRNWWLSDADKALESLDNVERNTHLLCKTHLLNARV